MDKRWVVKDKIDLNKKDVSEDIIDRLLAIRGVESDKEKDEFLRAGKAMDISIKEFGIDKRELEKSLKRLKKAYEKREKVVIYGDYDADGITGTAILWEVLYELGFDVLPFIPRRSEGYGLTEKGIKRIKKKIGDLSLIVTVDNGIVAKKGIEICKKMGVEVVVTDHHLKEKGKLGASGVVHTTKLSGSGVAWVLAREVVKMMKGRVDVESYLDLACLGAITDMIAVVGPNRSIVKDGLEVMRKTRRVGTLEIARQAGVDIKSVGTYEIGYMIGPRLNAMGRIDEAMDSLRALCVKDKGKAREYARILGEKNRDRQEMTDKMSKSAREMAKVDKDKKVFVISRSDFDCGVIGLVAGKVCDSFYRPAVVVCESEGVLKASARSIEGINIIEEIRKFKEILLDCGGHPMAAGFSMDVDKLDEFREGLEREIEKYDEAIFEKRLYIDLQIRLGDVDYKLYEKLLKLEPYGIGNKQPVFMVRGVRVFDKRVVGNGMNHLKLKLDDPKTKKEENIEGEVPYSTDLLSYMDTIGFWLGFKGADIGLGDLVDVAFTICENEWNGKKSLQLVLKDIRREEKKPDPK